jgi:hypothetical protein
MCLRHSAGSERSEGGPTTEPRGPALSQARTYEG